MAATMGHWVIYQGKTIVYQMTKDFNKGDQKEEDEE